MNMQDQILEELSTNMQSHMDFEILTDVLVKSCGWHRVDLDRFTDNHHAVDITHWLADHCKHTFKRNGADFVFEDKGDAVNFSLRWL